MFLKVQRAYTEGDLGSVYPESRVLYGDCRESPDLHINLSLNLNFESLQLVLRAGITLLTMLIRAID